MNRSTPETSRQVVPPAMVRTSIFCAFAQALYHRLIIREFMCVCQTPLVELPPKYVKIFVKYSQPQKRIIKSGDGSHLVIHFLTKLTKNGMMYGYSTNAHQGEEAQYEENHS